MSSRTLFLDLTPIRESRDFRLLWLSQAATSFGRQVVIVAVPYQVYVLTHSSLAVGLLGVFQAVPIVVTGLYGGALADRYDRRRIQLIGKTVSAACSLTLALTALGLHVQVALIYGVVAVSAAASTMDQAARSANVPRLVRSDLLPSAMTLTQSVLQAAAIVGPALSGFVVAGVGVSGAYLLDVLGFLPAAALIWRMSPMPPSGAPESGSSWRAALEGLTFVRRHRLLKGLFAADLVAMIFGMPTAVFPALALTVFGVGATGLGLLYAAPAVGALVGSLL
ncbi:MAG: MFS transporter, partial [Candidatus Dormibacteraeota bacterium]|nr:MFS transporter [Candidatus Dormibacteraeota bacterium]